MERNRQYLKGRVLDFGAGTPATCRQPQPYRDLVDGEYCPVDVGSDWMEPMGFGSIICTQVMQYIEIPHILLAKFWGALSKGGHLVMTYPTNWDEVESSDLWRFTRAGMEALLDDAGFTIVTHERRAEIDLGGFKFPFGYGVVARAD